VPLCTSTYTLALPCSKFSGSKDDFRFSSLLFADLRDMTTASSSSSYANALRGTPGPCAPVQALPLHHAPLFQENKIFVNLRGAAVDYTQKERDSFLKDDLGLQNEDVLDIFLDLPPCICTSLSNFCSLRGDPGPHLRRRPVDGHQQFSSLRRLGSGGAACHSSCYWSPTTFLYFSAEAPF
jgi:hypothetical protein